MALNTGIITFLNHRRQVPAGVSEVTFAHEMGHNFGSEHDVGPQCIPGGSEGNYLMFSSASSGSEPNNRKFSPCSVDFISAILHDMLSNQGSRENCLIESGGPICGNTIREGDEECDCGFTEDECRNKCCFSPSNPHKAKGCTLTPNVMCR
ncbi:disintegrin and metalloproteinase domain-containing protein 10-like [Ixodes scapularis]|uniref:disintegrin and metalloproteinase domain-containing protein 10-like n=1 Tax=Ixodes scapularis TaxID=6945 RepID=UPI001C39086E|nr:disintegrin and metalloproteinase domain-containing protein 10-like [Ixodes scapularis]